MLKQAAAAAALVNNPLLVGNNPPATSTASTASEADLLGSILKSNPALMLNPAAMLGLNPSLYAVQLAQLQLLASQGGAAASAAGTASSLDALRRLSDTEAASNLRKRKHEDDDPALAGLNLTSAAKSASPAASPRLAESPLDLSGSKNQSNAKIPKLGAASAASEDTKMPLSWPPFMHPLIAAGALTPEAISRLQMGLPPASMAASATSGATSEGENPLKRMNEIAKGTSAAAAVGQGPGSPGSKMVPGGARPSAWQSQWLNRGPESNKDIFKCVWCKESFASLASLTTHMKETKHFGASIPASPQLPPSPATMSRPSLTSTGPTAALRSPTPTASAVASAAASKNRDILKEQLPMPRKLVRGQDVWLGRGEQQTRDILKCMWCGESFRSLDLMTKHMQETKHYTKVISQVINLLTHWGKLSIEIRKKRKF